MEKYKAAAATIYHGASERREHFSIVSFCGKRKNQGTRWRMGVGKWRDKLTTNWAGTVGSVSIFFLPDSFAEIINYVPKKKRIRVFFHCRIFGEKNKKTGGKSRSHATHENLNSIMKDKYWYKTALPYL